MSDPNLIPLGALFLILLLVLCFAVWPHQVAENAITVEPRIDMPITRNTLGLPRAKRVWYTMETEDGEFMMIEGDVLHAQVDSQQDFIEVQCDSMPNPLRHMGGHRKTTLTVEFNGGFRMHRLEHTPSFDQLLRGATETVESGEITPEVMRRYKLE